MRNEFGFDAVRALRRQEELLWKSVEAASLTLVGSRTLSKALGKRRPSKAPPEWTSFITFARPVIEARNHIACERERLESELDKAISRAVGALKGKRWKL